MQLRWMVEMSAGRRGGAAACMDSLFEWGSGKSGSVRAEMVTFTSEAASFLPSAAMVKSAGTPGAAMETPWPSQVQAKAPAGSAALVAGTRRLPPVTGTVEGRVTVDPTGRESLLAAAPAAEAAPVAEDAARVGDLRSASVFPGDVSLLSAAGFRIGGAGIALFGRGCISLTKDSRAR